MTLWLLFGGLAVLLGLGLPIGMAMAASAALVLLATTHIPIVIVAQRYFDAADSFSLLAVPLFVLAGELMSASGITLRLVAFSRAMMGHLRGGLAQANILSNMFMAAISGSALADLVAIGSIMIPAMKREGYRASFAAAVTACASMMAPIIPPSVIAVVYGAMTGVSIGALFVGGIIPGVIAGVGLMGMTWLIAPRVGAVPLPRADAPERRSAAARALPAAVMPVMIVGGITSGVFTPTEAGAFAVVYALAFGIATRSHSLASIYHGMLGAALTAASALITLCGAAVFSWLLAREGIAQVALAAMLSITDDPNVAVVILIVFYFLVGTFLEPTPALIITVPVMAPIIARFGFDPTHFGIVTIMMLVLGAVTPPVGILAMVAGKLAGISFADCFRGLIPFTAAWLVVVLFVAFNPWTVTFLPRLFSF